MPKRLYYIYSTYSTYSIYSTYLHRMGQQGQVLTPGQGQDKHSTLHTTH